MGNLDKLNTKKLEVFSNEIVKTATNKSIKNLMIKVSHDTLSDFKVLAMNYYRDNNLLSNFSYRHFLAVVLLNIEKKFEKEYGFSRVDEVNEEWVKFFKRPGNKNLGKIENMDKLNFYFPVEYADLYFKLMYTYYILEVEKEGLNCYSISLFFNYIVHFIKKNKLQVFEVQL